MQDEAQKPRPSGRGAVTEHKIQTAPRPENSVAQMSKGESRAFLRSLPGYPFLPCKRCGYNESCECIGWERAKAWHPGLILS